MLSFGLNDFSIRNLKVPTDSIFTLKMEAEKYGIRGALICQHDR
jgi:hypothetical protein